MPEPSDPRIRKPDPGARVELTPVESTPEQLLDFSNCHALSSVAGRLVALRDRGVNIETSASPLSPSDVGRRLNSALGQVWEEQRILYDQRKAAAEGYSTGQLPLLPVDQLDTILANNGITGRGRLREAIAQSLRSGTNIGRSFLDPMDDLLQRGRHNPIWQLDRAEFARRYPESSYPESSYSAEYSAEPDATASGSDPLLASDDTEQQVAVRWRQIRARESADASRTAVADQHAWEQSLDGRTWNRAQIIGLSYATGDTAGDAAGNASRKGQERYQAAVARAQVADNEAKARTAQHRADGHAMIDTSFIKEYSIAGQIQQAFEAVFATQSSDRSLQGRRAEVRNTINTDQRTYPAIARTLELPISNQPNVTMRVTILSRVEPSAGEFGPPKEMATEVAGVVLESVAGVSLLAGGRPRTSEQIQAFSNAWQQLLQVEAQVRQQLGVELNITQYLRQFAP